LFLYRFATYHWKGLEEDYNFMVEKTINQNSYTKVMIIQSFKVSNTYAPLGSMVAPWGNMI
jgi:hypothetical protein